MAALAMAGGVGAGERAWGQGELLPIFRPPVLFGSGGGYPFGLAAGDVTGPNSQPDGYPELAIVNGGFDVNRRILWSGMGVRIYRNTGNWEDPADGLAFLQDITDQFHDEFDNPITVPADVRFAHMDEDEYLDLVISASSLDPDDENSPGIWGVFVYLWNPDPPIGQPKFEFKSFTPTPLPVRGLAVADFDLDGLNDVAVAPDLNLWYVPIDQVYVLRNDPSDPGRLDLAAAVVLDIDSHDSPAGMVVADFNRTSGPVRPDIVTGNLLDNNISLLTNTGGFGFTTAHRNAPCGSWHFHAMATGRFSANTLRHDIAGLIYSEGVIQVLHGDGRGNFSFDCSQDELDTYYLSPPPLPFVPAWDGIAVGQLNLGTKPDLVVTRPSKNTSAITFLLGRGDGAFQYVAGNPSYHKALDTGNGPDYSKMAIQVICADLNQDGLDDVITANHESHNVTVLINAMVVIP